VGIEQLIKAICVKYSVGFAVLWFIGYMGGDIIATAIHIGIVYGVLEWWSNRNGDNGK